MGWLSRKSDDEKHAEAWADNIDALRDRADNADAWADRMNRWGVAPDRAERLRTNAGLDRHLADQQENCYRSGGYRRGERQHDAVEEQTGKGWM